MRVSGNMVAMAVLGLMSAWEGLSSVAAQSAQPPKPPVFGVDVTLVAVPVFVTRKDGSPVRGLTAEDFEVEEGGKKVPIAAFQSIDVDAPPTVDSEARLAGLPVAAQAEARRQFLLLIDVRFSPRAGLMLGRKAATAYVRDSLAPGDLVSVATIGPSGLRILTSFTTDHNYVAEVIAGVSTLRAPGSDPLGLSSSGLPGAGDAATTAPEAGGSGEAGGGRGSIDVEQELAEQDALILQAGQREYRHLVSGFLDDLEKLIQRLAALRGRKQIVLFSGGFTESTWLGPDPDATPLRATMERLYRAAARADVVIHSVDLVGIQDSIDLASQTGPNGNLDSTGPAQGARLGQRQDSGRGTLIALSSNTGGRAIRPRGDFARAFGEVDQTSRHSYVIAFAAPEPDNGKSRFRKLKVRVRRPDLSVSHRAEYSIPPPPSAVGSGAGLQATEAIAKGLTGGALRLHLSTLPHRDPEGKTSVHAVLRIEGPALAEAAQGPALPVQIYGYALAEGRVLEGLAVNTSLDLSKLGKAVRSSGINLVTAFPVPTENVDLRFFVRTGTAEVTGSIQRSVTVPAFNSGERVLSAPMFLLPGAGQVVVPFQPKNRPLIRIPFYAGDSRFVPDAASRLIAGQARDLCVFVWRDRTGAAPPLDVTGEFRQSGQAPRPLQIEGVPRVVPEADGFDRYLLTVRAPESPGDYALRLTLVESGTGRASSTEIAVVVER